mmetsp:Transcript_42576/g.99938  ORF Transcript_42576/g.99938 Transcript_42576/m.99938 type:complete len:151 (-) Transcript_42576:889-1341(-)
MGCGASSVPNRWVGTPKPKDEQGTADAAVPTVHVDGFEQQGSSENKSHPAEPAVGDSQGAAAKSKLPAGWTSKIDPETMAVYYVNHATKITSWVLPEEDGGAAHIYEAAESSEQPQNLPPGWTRKVDPESNKPYYVNHATQQTQWELPSS